MGWYTSGPGGMQYKYGNVVAAALDAEIGTLAAIPRLGGEVEVGPYAFLGRVQRDAQARGLSWVPLSFDLDLDPSGESMPVPLDVDPFELLSDLVEHAEMHGETLRALVLEGDEDTVFDGVSVSIEFSWSVAPDELPALFAWLNDGLDGAPFTSELLSQGRFDDRPWYHPPESLAAVFATLAEDDPSRHLVACMLGAAAVSGGDFSLYQPDDDFSAAASFDEDSLPPAAILFKLEEHPFALMLSRAFGVPESVESRVFYVYRSGLDVEMPSEEDPSVEAMRSGFAFTHFFVRMMKALDQFDLVVPRAEQGGHNVQFGWHGEASFEALSKAFVGSGVAPLSLSRFLDPSSMAFHEWSTKQRLDYCQTLMDEDPVTWAAMGHFVHGGELPEEVSLDSLILLWCMFGQLDLPEDALERLGAIVQHAVSHGPHAAESNAWVRAALGL